MFPNRNQNIILLDIQYFIYISIFNCKNNYYLISICVIFQTQITVSGYNKSTLTILYYKEILDFRKMFNFTICLVINEI